MTTDALSKLTAIVRTGERPKSLGRLVRSIRRFYPELKTLVADDSVEPRLRRDVEHFRLPSHSGRAACQNALLARVRTPYFLLLDDRAELHRGSHVQQLLQLVADDKLDVAAGDVVACRRRFLLLVGRRPQPQHGICQFAGSELTLHRGVRSQGEGYKWCDLVGDFFVARTGKVRAMGGWDPELRDDAREEFFVRAHRQGLRVGIAPEATVWSWDAPGSSQPTEPEPSRMELAVAKMGLERMTDFAGNVIKAPRRAAA